MLHIKDSDPVFLLPTEVQWVRTYWVRLNRSTVLLVLWVVRILPQVLHFLTQETVFGRGWTINTFTLYNLRRGTPGQCKTLLMSGLVLDPLLENLWRLGLIGCIRQGNNDSVSLTHCVITNNYKRQWCNTSLDNIPLPNYVYTYVL